MVDQRERGVTKRAVAAASAVRADEERVVRERIVLTGVCFFASRR